MHDESDNDNAGDDDDIITSSTSYDVREVQSQKMMQSLYCVTNAASSSVDGLHYTAEVTWH